MDDNFTHLGHPLILPAKNRVAAYNFVLDKFLAKLPNYKANMLSHAARLELIRSVFSSIPVYYMSNILFTKKFIAKLTAIIRTFWWTGIKDDNSSRSMCLRAWKDICTSKREGGLGIRNLQAMNQGLILAAAWRLASSPNSHMYLVLKSKYFLDTSIWAASPNHPKSAFWSSVLKMLPKLKGHCLYHITQGNLSVWSTPWCSAWTNLHNHLIIQPHGFIYPARVSDLWLPGQKNWNTNLINTLFQEPTASNIIHTTIVNDDCPDILFWDLTPNGKCNSKSTYKLCLQELQAQPRNQPLQISSQVKTLLNQVWKQKMMAPRVQTFAWRLLRKALPTGLRASRFSVHISKQCCRCAQDENEMHIFFLCDFARAAWFTHPWYLRSDLLTENHLSMQSIILAMLSMNHPFATIPNIFNFMWCIWKSRNDCLFDRKSALPHQVHLSAVALAEQYKFQITPSNDSSSDKHSTANSNTLLQEGCTLRSDLFVDGAKVYSDASFKCSKIPGLPSGGFATGIGVFLKFLQDQKNVQIQIQASAPASTSPLQAEALALLLAAKVSQLLQVDRPTFLTDNLSLARAAATRSVLADSTPWTIRPWLANFFRTTDSLHSQVFHIPRQINGVAHNVAHQVLSRNTEPVFRCFGSAHRNMTCPVISLLSTVSLQGYVLHAVLCY